MKIHEKKEIIINKLQFWDYRIENSSWMCLESFNAKIKSMEIVWKLSNVRSSKKKKKKIIKCTYTVPHIWEIKMMCRGGFAINSFKLFGNQLLNSC